MPILDLQRKMAEKGRIRMGQKVPTRDDDKLRPDKLDTFKLTSSDKAIIEAAADLYGGGVKPFENDQWGVVTATSVLEVIVPPGDMAFSQWREMWGKGYCARRCDGRTEINSDGPCQCPADPGERAELAAEGKACKDTTRLSVMLPDLPGVGLWRLESHGYYAAVELAGAIEVIQSLAPSTLVRARLSGVKRSVVRFDRDGNPRTQGFVVPSLDLADVRLSELMAPSGGGVSVAIETRSGVTAVPELPEGPRLSIAEQLGQEPEPTTKRSNAAAELPATGLQPGGAPPTADEDEGDVTEAEVVDEGGLPDGWQKRNRKLQAEVHDIFQGETKNGVDRRRKALISMACDGRSESSKDLDDEEWTVLFTATEDLKAGRTELFLRATGDFEIRPIRGEPVPPAAARAADGLTLPSSTDEWRALLNRVGVTQRELLEEAWSLTGQKGAPGSLQQLVGHDVADDVLAWLHQKAAA